MLGNFFEKKKRWPQMIKMSNSARNGKKNQLQMAVSPPFPNNIIKVIVIPKLTAVTHFLAEFLR